jgi:hypothetical protein
MKKYFWICLFLLPLQLLAQDTTMNNLIKDMDAPATEKKQPVKIFNSEKVINANTTEVVGKGKMEFNVTHNFQDIAGSSGGIKNFFGLDKAADVRIGFHIGLTNRLNLNVAHIKGDEIRLRPDTLPNGAVQTLPDKLYEIALKYQLLRQLENDPSHPVSVTLFINTVISTAKAIPGDGLKNFKDFGDRTSQVYQLIIAKKIGKISLQLNPTLAHLNNVPAYDDATTFAVGGAARIPFSRRFAFIVDYFHCFISDKKKGNYYAKNDVKFDDPLGIGVEIITAGHVFSLKFTNTTAIMENQFIPYNSNSWSKGQYRWGFNISRTFSLWRPKK